MIRYSLLTLGVLFVMGYAWKDWYKSLCALILFMGIAGRPDIPTYMLGVQGLNPFNMMLVNVLLAWAASRRHERRSWDMPAHVTLLLGLYLGVVLVAFARCYFDPAELLETKQDLISNYLINTVKWTIPGLLLFDGCRDRNRFVWGLYATLGIYFLLALQTARLVSPSMDVAELSRRAYKILGKQTGHSRVDLSTMLAGASWALFASRALFRAGWLRLGLLLAAAAVLYAQVLTAGRAGYVAWAVVGLVLCSLRWRAYLLVAPLAVLGVTLAVPAVVDRALEGISTGEIYEDRIDESKVTAGRSVIWPYVIEKIRERPLVGYGRQAMRRTGLARFAAEELNDRFGHPHNAYLELLLDSGLVGFLLVMPFYALVLVRGLWLFADSRSPIFIAAGGSACAIVLAQLGGSIGAQSFYPREGTVGMWCAIMLLFRVLEERRRALALVRRSTAVPRERQPVPTSPEPQAAAAPLAARSRPKRRRRPVVERLLRPGGRVDGLLWAR